MQFNHNLERATEDRQTALFGVLANVVCKLTSFLRN